MLRLRLLTAAVLVPAALAGLFLLPNRAWALASGIFVLVGAWEWARLSGLAQGGRLIYAAALGIAGTVVALGGVDGGPLVAARVAQGLFLAGAAFWVVVALPWLAAGWHCRHPVLLLGVGILVLLPAWTGATVLQRQPSQLLLLMATIWIADSGAYFAGRRFGRHKLAPRVSPGKSWEGVAGAALAVAGWHFLAHRMAPGLLPGGPGWAGLVLLEALVAVSIVGDLFESWMKREAGCKDSGNILPGHGGVLDRIDSLTAALPVAALMVWWTGGGA
jgi:phosphatidate cytidylyltransferase